MTIRSASGRTAYRPSVRGVGHRVPAGVRGPKGDEPDVAAAGLDRGVVVEGGVGVAQRDPGEVERAEHAPHVRRQFRAEIGAGELVQQVRRHVVHLVPADRRRVDPHLGEVEHGPAVRSENHILPRDQAVPFVSSGIILSLLVAKDIGRK